MPFYAAVNGNTARSRGTELSLKSEVSSDLSLSAAYTYTDAKLTSAFVVAGTTFGADGTRLPGVPRNQASLGVDFRRPVSAQYTMIAHADTAYRGEVPVALPGSLGGSATVPGFWMSNANVGVEHERLESDSVRRQLVEYARGDDGDSARCRRTPAGRELAVEASNGGNQAALQILTAGPLNFHTLGSTSSASRSMLERIVAGSLSAKMIDVEPARRKAWIRSRH